MAQFRPLQRAAEHRVSHRDLQGEGLVRLQRQFRPAGGVLYHKPFLLAAEIPDAPVIPQAAAGGQGGADRQHTLVYVGGVQQGRRLLIGGAVPGVGQGDAQLVGALGDLDCKGDAGIPHAQIFQPEIQQVGPGTQVQGEVPVLNGFVHRVLQGAGQGTVHPQVHGGVAPQPQGHPGGGVQLQPGGGVHLHPAQFLIKSGVVQEDVPVGIVVFPGQIQGAFPAQTQVGGRGQGIVAGGQFAHLLFAAQLVGLLHIAGKFAFLAAGVQIMADESIRQKGIGHNRMPPEGKEPSLFLYDLVYTIFRRNAKVKFFSSNR